MRKPMPYIPGEVRKLLLADAEFLSLLHGGKVTCREVPDPLSVPHVTVKSVGNQGNDPMLRRLIVQVTPWVPGRDVSGIEEDPDVTAWNLASYAGEKLGRSKNIIIDDSHAFSMNWLEGPTQLEDKTRGVDRVIYYAPIRIAAHVRRRS